MKLNKIKTQIEKLLHLIQSLEKSQEISDVERDLMLSYIRKMYELALVTEEKSAPVKKTPKNKKPKAAKKKETEKKEEVEKEPEPKVSAREVNGEAPTEEVQSSAIEIPEDILELFTHKKAVELSEKLSQRPITDLSKSMGINEKIFTVKELFGGNQQSFDDAISQLNAFDNFTDAKEYLIQHIAIVNDWGATAKKKKAGNFIKLVRRRYQ